MLNLTDLKYFTDSIKLGSMKAASEANFVTPPAITLGIQRLENDLGVELLKHSRNGFHPSEKGYLLLKLSQNIFRDCELIKEALHKKSEIQGILVIATQQSLAQAYLADIFALARIQHPDLQLVIKTGTTNQNLELIKSGAAEVAFMLDNVDLKGLDITPVYEGHFIAVGHTRNKNGYFLTEDTRESMHFQKKYKKMFKHELPIVAQISSWGTILSLAEAGVGSTYIPDFLLREKKSKSLFPKNSPLNFPYKVVCASTKGQSGSANVLALIEICKKVFKGPQK